MKSADIQHLQVQALLRRFSVLHDDIVLQQDPVNWTIRVLVQTFEHLSRVYLGKYLYLNHERAL